MLERTYGKHVTLLLRKGLPERARWGFIHYDLCAENLVRRPDGIVVAIDNETLRRGFSEFDVARTWSRWPLTPSSHVLFERSYRRLLGCSEPEAAEQRAWRTLATLKRVHLRHRLGQTPHAALIALQQLAENEEESAVQTEGISAHE
jgi:Ser/Thr protein kinase RdoA (MazF antagonist)